MIIAYNEVKPQLVRQNLPGTGACNTEIQSGERSRPGCSLHQGASSWSDAPAGAAPGQKTGTRLYKPQRWILSSSRTRQVHPCKTKTEWSSPPRIISGQKQLTP